MIQNNKDKYGNKNKYIIHCVKDIELVNSEVSNERELTQQSVDLHYYVIIFKA